MRPAGLDFQQGEILLEAGRVLTARDAMQPLSGTPEITVAAEETIQAVMERVQGSAHPVGVEDGGQIIGEVTRDSVLARILDPTGGRTG